MAKAADRGTKRTCQNNACGARFYDLNRDPIVCPICSSVFELAVPTAASVPTPAEASRRPVKKPELVGAAPDELPDVEAEDVLVDVEGAEEPIAADEEEPFLEEEDEGGDVTGIIGGGTPPEGDEEV